MAARKKAKKAEPTKRSALLGPIRQVCLSSVSMLALQAAMPPRRRAGVPVAHGADYGERSHSVVHYYKDGERHVVDLETSNGL
jgi:hypothetical protein